MPLMRQLEQGQSRFALMIDPRVFFLCMRQSLHLSPSGTKKKDTKRILFQTHNNAQSIAALLNSMLFSIYDMKHSTYVVAGIKNECPTSSMMFLSGLQGLRCLG